MLTNPAFDPAEHGEFYTHTHTHTHIHTHMEKHITYGGIYKNSIQLSRWMDDDAINCINAQGWNIQQWYGCHKERNI